jgi:cytochrome d ubiquinol oxidase subunit I
MHDDLLVNVSRWQFALTAAFHMTFPAVTVGLGVFLVGLYGGYLRTGRDEYLVMYRFWRDIFAMGFGLGVVAGIVMTFELGLNWGTYAAAVGPILGVVIGLEVATAFFVEAGFLGIMLYGDGRVSRRVTFVATCMVAFGALLSTFWIVSANSWMQTPAGFAEVNGQFQPTDWGEAILNPAFTYRFPHIVVGVLLASAFLVTGTAAYYLRQGVHLPFARRTFSLGLGVISLLIPVQLYLGDSLATFMATAQPAKLEAFEGNWTSDNTGYNLVVIPDQADQRNLLQITVPCLGSIIAKDWTCRTPLPGLAETSPALQPPMPLTFYGFRLMFYLAMAMFGVSAIGVLLRLQCRLFTTRWFHSLVFWMLPTGVIAIIGGWVLSETGRQPWIVYGQLQTADGVSPLAPSAVVASLALFLVTYAVLLIVYIYYVARVIRRGPGAEATVAERDLAPTHVSLPHAAASVAASGR